MTDKLLQRLTAPGPKRILALDGGGIRGALTLGYLEKLEEILQQRHGNRSDFRLCDYFDLIGGTSTGSIIATCLAMGRTVKEVKALYLSLGGEIFGQKTGWFRRLSAKFSPEALRNALRAELGDETLGSEKLRTGLCIVAKRADTGSTWPLLNHPNGDYYPKNKAILLRRVVRASTAAPTYFEPETLDVGQGEIGAFVDGGVSMFNNPALLLFLVATLRGFPFHWDTGGDKLMIVSVGTGNGTDRFTPDQVMDNRIWNWASQIPDLLMRDASLLGHIMLQYLSDSPTRTHIDREFKDMKNDLLGGKAMLHYLRYNVRLEENELGNLGFSNADIKSLREMSNAGNRDLLYQIGKKAAQAMTDQHFPVAFNLS